MLIELEDKKINLAELRQKNASINLELERVNTELTRQRELSNDYQSQLAQEKKYRLADEKDAALTVTRLEKALNESENQVNVRTAALDKAKQTNVEVRQDLLQSQNANTLVHRQLDRLNVANDKLQAESTALLAEKNEIAKQLSTLTAKHQTTQKMFDSNQKNQKAEIDRLKEMVDQFIDKSTLPD